jgi:PIN domain nuclease of toxin-antitoxin system
VIAYLDTQVVVWLCQKQLNKLTRAAIEAIEANDLLISPMVMLELQYLYELKRTLQPAQALIGQLEAEIGVQVCGYPFPSIIQSGLHESWTRDPFDRTIVAHARSNRYSPLVTSDAEMRRHYPKSVW